VDRDASRSLVVKGRTPTVKDPGHGPLTLRLRDVDFADVFQVLTTLGVGGFVVDGDVAGRASVEITRATLDETLAALRKASGVEIGARRRGSACGAARAGGRGPRATAARPRARSAPRYARCPQRWPADSSLAALGRRLPRQSQRLTVPDAAQAVRGAVSTRLASASG
jgi:hypothetical protein